MGIIELILLSIGLGMDAFAVSVCKGISMKKELEKSMYNRTIFWWISSNNASYRIFFWK